MTEKEVTTENNGKENNGNVDQDDSELEIAIIRQIEYYFGDVNMPRDKFLREQVKLDEGWVPLEVLITFNRLAKLTTNIDVIGKALNKSTSGLLELSDDNKKVRRNPELPPPEMNEDRRKELKARTVYAKGLPKDSTLDELLTFFKTHGEVENVIMRRYQDRQTKTKFFKGSVFVTYKTKEQAQSFLDEKDLKYKETELLRLWQDNYLESKQEEYSSRKEKKGKKSKDKQGKEDEEEKEAEFSLPTGTVLHFSEGNEKMSRENVKEALTTIGAEIAYIDYKVGDKEGWVRLSKENSAKDIFGKIVDGKMTISDSEVVFRVLEGDEENTYLEKIVVEMIKRRKNQKNKKSNWQYKGRQQGGRKRRQGPHRDAPAEKVKPADS